MTMGPITAYRPDGAQALAFPHRAVAAAADGPARTTVWQFDAEGFIEKIHVRAEILQVIAVLGLDGLDEIY